MAIYSCIDRPTQLIKALLKEKLSQKASCSEMKDPTKQDNSVGRLQIPRLVLEIFHFKVSDFYTWKTP